VLGFSYAGKAGEGRGGGGHDSVEGSYSRGVHFSTTIIELQEGRRRVKSNVDGMAHMESFNAHMSTMVAIPVA
jgi:hypothetical protein